MLGLKAFSNWCARGGGRRAGFLACPGRCDLMAAEHRRKLI